MKTLQRRAHHEYGKQQPQESLLAPVLASHARIGCCIPLVVRMLDRDKVTLLRDAICIQKRKKPLHQSSDYDSYLLTTFFQPLQSYYYLYDCLSSQGTQVSSKPLMTVQMRRWVELFPRA